MSKRSIFNDYYVKVKPMPEKLREINLFRLISDLGPMTKLIQKDKKSKFYISNNLTGENVKMFVKNLGNNLSLLKRKVNVESSPSDNDVVDESSD